MATNKQRVVALFLVSVMALSALAGGGTATVPSTDTSTGDATTTTSQVQDDTVLGNVSGVGNKTYTVQVNVTPDDTVELEVTVNGSDTVVATNTSAENVSVADGGNGAHYNLSVEETEIDDMERTLNENVTVDFVVFDADNSSNSTTVTAFLNFTDGRTVENIDDVDADPDTSDAPVETEDLEDTLTRSSILQSLDFSELDVDDRTISGESSEVVLVFSNDTVADDAANAVASDADDGDALYGMTLVLQGDETTMPIRVYNEEPPDEIDDDDDGDTYGVYQDGGVGGEDGIVIHLGEDFDDDDEVAVTGVLNAGRWARTSHWAATSSFGMSVGLFITGVGDLSGTDVVISFAPLLIGAPVARRRPVEDVIEIDEPESPGESQPTVEAEG